MTALFIVKWQGRLSNMSTRWVEEHDPLEGIEILGTIYRRKREDWGFFDLRGALYDAGLLP